MNKRFLNILRPQSYFRKFATLPAQSEVLATRQAQSIFEKGLAQWNKDDLKGAEESFILSIKSFPTSNAYFNLANVYHCNRNYQKAIETWQKSLDLEARADAHVNIANVLAIILKEPLKAVEHYEIAIKLSPLDGEINYNFAVVLDSMGNLNGAIEQYSIAVSWGVENAEKNLRNARARWVSQEAERRVLKERPT